MFNKHRRILWLLNHKTLMPYEVPLLQRLGFEVFVPKIVPKTGLRNSAVDFSFDQSLSLPAAVLQALNAFNFYEDPWTPEIVLILNRYFGGVFVIPHLQVIDQAIDQFEGQIVLRAFGLENGTTYRQFLESLHGPLVMRKIGGIRERFWFGEGYDNLHEIEPPLFQERRLFLPLGIPDSFFNVAGQWTGHDKRILFICPNAATDPYYSRIYRKFKADFGDLPHVIVGAQNVPVDDPHMAGFVSDGELHRLYLDCAVLYYHSTEVRHVHYSPVEAAIDGMPVVFHKGSLLDRLSRGADKGAVGSVAEARALVERILAGDQSLVAEIQREQREIAYLFSDAYCAPVWKAQMEERGFMKGMAPRTAIATLVTECTRTLMKSRAHGRLRTDPHRETLAPFVATLSAAEARQRFGSSLEDGVVFGMTDWPAVVDLIDGVGPAEGWGRWSEGSKVTVSLKHKLEGRFRLELVAMGYGENAGVPLRVRIGDQVRMTRLIDSTQEAQPRWLYFNLTRPANVIEIEVPHPTRAQGQARELGVGLVSMRAKPEIVLSLHEARERLGATLEDGWSLSDPALPAFVDSVEGLYPPESWGRWSEGPAIRLVLKHWLTGRFRLRIHAFGFRDNAGPPVAVHMGAEVRTLRLGDGPEQARPQWLHFDLAEPTNVIEIEVPRPTRPEGDLRELGIGLVEIGVASPVMLALEDARTELGCTLEDGWSFSDKTLPAFVDSFEGLYDPEPWGRWSRGERVSIELKHLLSGAFQLQLRATGFGPNASMPVTLRIGAQECRFSLPAEVGTPIRLAFDLDRPSNVIELDVPAPTSAPGDGRLLGIGFHELRLVSTR